MEVTSSLLGDNKHSLPADPSEALQRSKKFFFSSIGKAHVINALYGIGYTIQIAMLPYLLISSNAGIEHNGYLLTLFSLLQFLGSIIFGRLADVWGVKQSYCLSLCSSALMYFMLTFCEHTWAYYVSFLPAFFMQTFQASSLLVCLKTDTEKRTSAIGYLNLSYGVGIILGSLSAGMMVNFLGPRGNLMAAFISQILALYISNTLKTDPQFLVGCNNTVITIESIENGNDKETENVIVNKTVTATVTVTESEIETSMDVNTNMEINSNNSNINKNKNNINSSEKKINIRKVFISIKDEYTRVLELFKKTYGICLLIIIGLLPILMTKFAFAPIVVDMFKLTPSHTSYLLTYAGVITIFAEGILAPYLSSTFGDMSCCKYSIPLTLTGFLLLSLCGANEYIVLLLMTIPLCGGALLYICGTSQMTKKVEVSELGTAIGLNTSIFYAITIVAPYWAFKSYLSLGLGLYWLMCAFIGILLTVYIFLLDDSLLKIFKEEKEDTDYTFSDIKSIL